MTKSDDDNLGLVESDQSVDLLNQKFYSRFPYPWPPMSFPKLDDVEFETIMLNQSIGDWDHTLIPANAKIWIAGCGTNQAVYTALRFPQASIVGSDISQASLEICDKISTSLRIRNLSLRHESLSKVEYDHEFDYIVSTGVVHHTADPLNALKRVSRALKQSGVLELMVYNRFHRTLTSAFQKAVRLISRGENPICGFDEELNIAKEIINSGSQSLGWLTQYRNFPEAMFADTLLQPVERSYTVESLCSCLEECDLEILTPCYNQFDRSLGRASWNMEFGDSTLRRRIENLPDTIRWQISNLLLHEHSPMLWFFVQHKNGPHKKDHKGRHESRIGEEFLDCRFVRASTRLSNYVKRSDHDYEISRISVPYPVLPESKLLRTIIETADGRLNMRQILNLHRIDTTNLKALSDIRIQTTTSCCPYLRAVRLPA